MESNLSCCLLGHEFSRDDDESNGLRPKQGEEPERRVSKPQSLSDLSEIKGNRFERPGELLPLRTNQTGRGSDGSDQEPAGRNRA